MRAIQGYTEMTHIASGGEMVFHTSIHAGLLIVGAMLVAVGGSLYTVRARLKWPGRETLGYRIQERGFVIASVLVNVLDTQGHP